MPEQDVTQNTANPSPPEPDDGLDIELPEYPPGVEIAAALDDGGIQVVINIPWAYIAFQPPAVRDPEVGD